MKINLKNNIWLICLFFIGNIFAQDKPESSDICAKTISSLHLISTNYWTGNLQEALHQAQILLACESLDVDSQVKLHIQIATIYDRIGLHNNSRPMSETLTHIETAKRISKESKAHTKALIDLSYARYYYRAEIPKREFKVAQHYTNLALDSFTKIGDLYYGKADAEHLRGLFYLQQRDVSEATVWFNRSLNTEQSTERPRPVLLGDYQRHIGFLYLFDDQIAWAIPFFRNSYIIRKEANLIDQALFAAITYADVLLDTNDIALSKKVIDYALQTARKLKSSYGEASALLVRGLLFEAEGELKRATKTLNSVTIIATKINRESIINNVKNALKRIESRNVN